MGRGRGAARPRSAERAEPPARPTSETEPDADRLAALQTQLARAALALGKPDKALDCLESAHRLRPELLPMLRTFADFRYGRGEWKEAIALYESLLRAPPRVAAVRRAPRPLLAHRPRQGRGRRSGGGDRRLPRGRGAGDPARARRREALAPLLAAKEDWAGWIAEREALAAIVAEPERAALWEEIGDACAARLGDRARAEAAYRQAFEAEPERRAPIEKLLAIYQEDGRFEPAVEMLAALAKVETVAGGRGPSCGGRRRGCCSTR